MDVISDIERDYKGDSNRLQAMIKRWPHSDNPSSSLKFKALWNACQSRRVIFSIIGMVYQAIYSGSYRILMDMPIRHSKQAK